MSADEAMAFVREKRSVAFFPSANFEPAIKGFEHNFRTALMEARKQRGLASKAKAI
jgi:hypothetical protein